MSNKMLGNSYGAKPHAFAPRPFRSASPDVGKRCRKLLKHFNSDIFNIMDSIKKDNKVLYVQMYLKILEMTAKNDEVLYNREIEKMKLLLTSGTPDADDSYIILTDSEAEISADSEESTPDSNQ